MMVITAKTAPNFRLAILLKEKRKEKEISMQTKKQRWQGRGEGEIRQTREERVVPCGNLSRSY